MTEIELIARACETTAGFLAAGNERFEAHGATFIRNRDTPRRQDVNGVLLVRSEGASEIEALLKGVEEEYAGLQHHRLEVDPLAPPALAARLSIEPDYKESLLLALLLEAEPQAKPMPVEIRQVLYEADWLALRRLDEMWWRESSTDYFGPYDPELHDELTRSFRAKSPAVRTWQAWVDGGARAYLSSYAGENGVGMVEDLYTEPEYRHRGLATALLVHCVADARARGAGPIVIIADPKDTPKSMYVAMGFRPLYVQRTYSKKLAEDSRTRS